MADNCLDKPHAEDGVANLLDFTVRRQRGVVRSTFSAELNGLIDSIEAMLLLQCTLHQVFCGTDQSAQDMVDLLEHGQLYPPVDLCVDAKAVFDAISASDICDPAESSLKLHLISVRDRMSQGILRFLYWVDTRDMLADGLTKGGIDRALLDAICEHCKYECKHEPQRHTKCGQDKVNLPKSKFQRNIIHQPRSVHFGEGGLTLNEAL